MLSLYPTNPYTDCQNNLQKSAGFIQIAGVIFLQFFLILIQIIVNLGQNFENFIQIIEIPLREFSGVLWSATLIPNMFVWTPKSFWKVIGLDAANLSETNITTTFVLFSEYQYLRTWSHFQVSQSGL